MRVLNTATALALALSSGGVGAAQLGDPQRGLTYAQKNCTKCHAVEKGDMFSPTMIAPTFSAIAEIAGH